MKKATNFLGTTMLILAVLVGFNAAFVPIRLTLIDLGAVGWLYWLGIGVALLLTPITWPISFIMALYNHPGQVGLSLLYLIGAVILGALGVRLSRSVDKPHA